jgi:type IV pilus assembly protein PilA
MLKALKKRLKDQRGLTLIELLAVVVILGIIAAIAVPSIGGLIDNTKKDAHVANAQQMINAAKLAIIADESLQTGTDYVSLGALESGKYLETVKDPDGDNASYIRALALNAAITSDSAVVSFVKIVDGKPAAVKLVNTTRGVQEADKDAVPVGDLKRGSVN